MLLGQRPQRLATLYALTQLRRQLLLVLAQQDVADLHLALRPGVGCSGAHSRAAAASGTAPACRPPVDRGGSGRRCRSDAAGRECTTKLMLGHWSSGLGRPLGGEGEGAARQGGRRSAHREGCWLAMLNVLRLAAARIICLSAAAAGGDADVSMHVLRAGSTPAPVDPLACLLQEAQRRHFELVTWSTECL